MIDCLTYWLKLLCFSDTKILHFFETKVVIREIFQYLYCFNDSKTFSSIMERNFWKTEILITFVA